MYRHQVLFVYADDIFIRRIFDEFTAGLFASASIVGKVLIWLTLTLLGVYFPKFVQSRGKSSLKKLVLQMSGLVIVAEIFGQLGIYLIGKPLFVFLFGAKFVPAFAFVPSYFFSVMPMLFCIIFISLATALERGITLIYIHLFSYYVGFLLINFNSIEEYLNYIFLLNSAFAIMYFYSFRKELLIKRKIKI